MPELTYEQTADLADLILGIQEEAGANRENLVPFEIARRVLQAGYRKDDSEASLAAVKARFGDVRKEKVAPVPAGLWGDYSALCDQIKKNEELKRKDENLIRELIGEAGVIEVDGKVVARRIIQTVTATWTKDFFRRVKQQGDDSE